MMGEIAPDALVLRDAPRCGAPQDEGFFYIVALILRSLRSRRLEGRRRPGRLAIALALFACATVAHAVEPSEMLADSKLEQRARLISEGLRCLVCQNQSIDDSNAPLAKDLRMLVRERLVAGDSDEQTRAWLVARYGDFILLKPPLNAGTLLLWIATPMIFLIALALVVLRRHREQVETAALTPDEETRVAEMLAKPRQ